MNSKFQTIESLRQAFIDAGMPISKMWVYRQEQKGNLKLPRSTTNFKKAQGNRTIGSVRLITDNQIAEIVQAFMPGGKGYWSFEESTG